MRWTKRIKERVARITTKFKESIDVRGEIRDTVLFERRVLYCVPVPGENRGLELK